MHQSPTPPVQADFLFHAQEFSALAECVLMFIDMNNMLLGRAAPHVYESVLTAMQRMRPLLQRFDEPCKKLNRVSPIVVVDLLAKKIYPNVGVKISTAQACGYVAFTMQEVLTLALKEQDRRRQTQPPQKEAQEPIRVDPEKLKKLH